jgi:small GTP-binding protein
MRDVKCVLVGDPAVGKSGLCMAFRFGDLGTGYVSTVVENFAVRTTIRREEINFRIWDTPGLQEYAHLRPVSYSETDVILICFSLMFPASLGNVRELWLPEIRTHCPSTPVVLVGLQSDVREYAVEHPNGEWRSDGVEPVASKAGAAMARAIHAHAYVECSAMTESSVREVFAQALRAVPPPRSRRSFKQLLINAFVR